MKNHTPIVYLVVPHMMPAYAESTSLEELADRLSRKCERSGRTILDEETIDDMLATGYFSDDAEAEAFAQEHKIPSRTTPLFRSSFINDGEYQQTPITLHEAVEAALSDDVSFARIWDSEEAARADLPSLRSQRLGKAGGAIAAATLEGVLD